MSGCKALTTAQIEEITNALREPCEHCGFVPSQKEVAYKYGLSSSMVSRIASGFVRYGRDREDFA